MKQLKDSELMEIYKIWNQVYPACICWESIDGLKKFVESRENPYHFTVLQGGKLAAWICTFDREGRRWFTILVHSNKQGSGIGRSLIDHCKNIETELVGWMVPENKYLKRDGNIYKSPWGFYEKNGFEKTDVWLKSDELQTQKIIWSK